MGEAILMKRVNGRNEENSYEQKIMNWLDNCVYRGLNEILIDFQRLEKENEAKRLVLSFK